MTSRKKFNHYVQIEAASMLLHRQSVGWGYYYGLLDISWWNNHTKLVSHGNDFHRLTRCNNTEAASIWIWRLNFFFEIIVTKAHDISNMAVQYSWWDNHTKLVSHACCNVSCYHRYIRSAIDACCSLVCNAVQSQDVTWENKSQYTFQGRNWQKILHWFVEISYKLYPCSYLCPQTQPQIIFILYFNHSGQNDRSVFLGG